MAVRSKFDELHHKTDRQLIQLANAALDLGIRAAHQALDCAENWAFAERHDLTAERAYKEAARLIRLASDIPEDELRGLDSRLDHLREMLQGLSVLGTAAPPSEDMIPALARALWKARGCPEGLPEEDWFRAERALKLHTARVATPCHMGN
jgi:hypothetical protein